MLAFIEHQDELRKLQRDPSLLAVRGRGGRALDQPDHPLRAHRDRRTSSCAASDPQGRRARALLPVGEPRRGGLRRIRSRSAIDRHPNRHLGFGVGEHFCLGSHVARLELQVAYKHLLPRIEEIELAGPIERLHSALVGGVKHLPIRYKLRRA